MQLRFTCNDTLCRTCQPGEYVTYDTETRLAFTEPGHRPFEHHAFGDANRTVEGILDIMNGYNYDGVIVDPALYLPEGL